MKCPECEYNFEPVEYASMGQARCPECGEIIDIRDNDSDEEHYYEY